MSVPFIKLLESCKYLDFYPIQSICSDLNLELIQDADTLTICSEEFVIDINKMNLKVDVLFVNEELNDKTVYLNHYFRQTLRTNNFLLFYTLLRHFTINYNPDQNIKSSSSTDDHILRKKLNNKIRDTVHDVTHRMNGNSSTLQDDKGDISKDITDKDQLKSVETVTQQITAPYDSDQAITDQVYDEPQPDDVLMRLSPIILYKSPCGEPLLFCERLVFCQCLVNWWPSKGFKPTEENSNIFTHFHVGSEVPIKNELFEIKRNSIFVEGKRSREMTYLWRNGFSLEKIFDCFGIKQDVKSK